MSQIEGLGPKA